MNTQDMCRKLKELRTSKGISQEKAAKSIGISASALAMYETGDRVPRDDIKVAIAEYYGTNVSYIFFGDTLTKR